MPLQVLVVLVVLAVTPSHLPPVWPLPLLGSGHHNNHNGNEQQVSVTAGIKCTNCSSDVGFRGRVCRRVVLLRLGLGVLATIVLRRQQGRSLWARTRVDTW